MTIKNKSVGSHAVELLLSCLHIMTEPLEAVIFAPQIGDQRKCPICGKDATIEKVGPPYWMDAEDDE